MPKQCPTCLKANPASATYCYYDGRALTEVSQAGPRRPGALPFLMPFSFPNGQSCGNFDQLALACDCRWNEARTFLVNGIWDSFFRKIGRHDLAAAAAQAAKEADADAGLAYLLDKLPTDAVRRPALSLLAETEDLGTLQPGMDYQFKLVIGNKGGLVLTGEVATDCEWLFFGDRQGNVSRKLFQTRDNYTLFVRVLGGSLRAGPKPLEGRITIETNGGTTTVAVKALVPPLPFPQGEYAANVLAGATSPREVAFKAKAHPGEAAALFEQGAVKAWYASNGWTYPIQGTQGQGKGAIQQFFEALGLSKPPLLEINAEQIECQGEVGQQLTKKVTVSTKEAKFVHAEAHSDQAWIRVQPSSSNGRFVTIPLLVEVPPCPGESLHARVTIQGNGRQRFVVPVTLTVEASTADEEAGARSQRRLWIFTGIAAALLLIFALGTVALFAHRREAVPPPEAGGPPQQQAANEKGQPQQQVIKEEGQPRQQAAKTEAWWDGIPDQNLVASAAELKVNAPADSQAIFDRLRDKADTERFPAYEQLAAKLPGLVGNAKTREPLARFLRDCCVHEPSDLNVAQLRRALAELFPKEGVPFNPKEKGRELEDALYARQILFNAMAHKAVKPERTRSLADTFGMVFGLSLDTSAPADKLVTETEKLFAVRCYRNTAPTAAQSLDHALTVRATLIEKFPQHLPPTLRIPVDADLLAAGLGKGSEALWPKLEPIFQECLASDDAKIGTKLIAVYTKAHAELARKIVVVLAPQWKATAKAKLTLEEKAAALGKFLNLDLNKASRAPAFRLLLNPVGDADEEVSFDVLKTLLVESRPLTAEETEVFADILRDGERRIKARCFAVVNLGEGKQAVRAVPALVDVLRAKGDVKLLSLSIQALGRIGDKRQEVMTALRTLAASAAEEKTRLESLQVLEQLDPSALSVAQILERWTAEQSGSVQEALGKLLHSRLAVLKPEQMKELLPLLRDKDAALVVVGLKVVQSRKEAAADVAADVVDLLKRDEAKVRAAALEALKALGPAADKARKNLTQLLLDRWPLEKDADVREALGQLLQSRLTLLKPEQMKELLPLLRSKDADLVVVGLKVVRSRKEAAADVAEDVVDLLKHKEAKVSEAALESLKALGAAAGKAQLPKLVKILEQAPKYKRASLALTIGGILDLKDAKDAEHLVPFLLEGLHPKTPLGEKEKTRLNGVLVKMGQPAVEGSLTLLREILQLEFAGKDNIDYRKTLYGVLAELGPSCKSQANYQALLRLRNKEIMKKYKFLITASGVALTAMDPR